MQTQDLEREREIERRVIEFQRNNFEERYVGAHISKLQIPDEYSDYVLGQIDKFMKNPKNMLVFLSTPGLGKTYFCAALAEWMIRNFNSYRYHKEEGILKKLRECISEQRGDYLEALKLLTDDEIVIMDDVASGMNPEKNTYRDYEFRREVFFSFLDYRYNTMKPTIITSNLTRNQFYEVYSERIESRLFAEENIIIKIFDSSTDKRKIGM